MFNTAQYHMHGILKAKVSGKLFSLFLQANKQVTHTVFLYSKVTKQCHADSCRGITYHYSWMFLTWQDENICFCEDCDKGEFQGWSFPWSKRKPRISKEFHFRICGCVLVSWLCLWRCTLLLLQSNKGAYKFHTFFVAFFGLILNVV